LYYSVFKVDRSTFSMSCQKSSDPMFQSDLTAQLSSQQAQPPRSGVRRGHSEFLAAPHLVLLDRFLRLAALGEFRDEPVSARKP
jgi:hypothetical protein